MLKQRGIPLTLDSVARRMPSYNGHSSADESSANSPSLEIVTDVNLEVSAAETCAVVGASGSGKTTLLGIMAGMDRPDAGRVLLGSSDGEAERDLYSLGEEQRAQIRARDMGFVFQNFQLVADMSALDNVVLSLELSGHARGTLRERGAIVKDAQEWLARVGLQDRQRHFPRQLSGGEQQRVALARAFACEPGILFADEPTGSLDEHTAEGMIELLFSLNREFGATMVLVTHDPSLAARCANVYRLEKRRLSLVS